MAGLACAMVAALGLAVLWLPEPLPALVAAHVRHEPSPGHAALSSEELAAILAGDHAGTCQIRGQDATHIVLSEPAGPVTLLLMPSEPVGARVAFQAQGLHGELLPLRRGSVAVLSGSAAQSRAAADRIAAAAPKTKTPPQGR